LCLPGRSFAPSDAAAQDGVNRITASALENYHLAEVTAEYANEGGPLVNEPVIRLVASNAKSEHYAVLPWTAPKSNCATTFSVYIRHDMKTAIRLQLHDDQGNAVIADYRVRGGVFKLTGVGKASKLDLMVGGAADGWLRLALTATLTGTKGSVFMQLIMPDWITNFRHSVPALLLQGPMVESGNRPSAYSPPNAMNLV
jgi:hypothetical protein